MRAKTSRPYITGGNPPRMTTCYLQITTHQRRNAQAGRSGVLRTAESKLTYGEPQGEPQGTGRFRKGV